MRSLAADRQIVAALAAGPMTADELAHVMRMEILNSWTEAGNDILDTPGGVA